MTGKVRVPCCSTHAQAPAMCVGVSACTWSDDYALGVFNHVDCLVHVDLGVRPCDLHGLSRAGGGRAVASQDHVSQ